MQRIGLRKPAAYPVSPALPFQRPENLTDELHSVNARRFFENLLPEGTTPAQDEFDITKIRAFDWADFADRCDIERRLLVREMNRMIKVLKNRLPILTSLPDYTEGERATIRDIVERLCKQAEQLENAAKMITKVILE